MSAITWLLWSCFVSFSVIFTKWLVKYFRDWKMLSEIPGPKQFPFLGRAMDFNVKHEDFLKIWEPWWKKYRTNPSGLFKLSLLTQNIVVPCNAEMLEKCMNGELYKKALYELMIPWLNDGLLLSNGDKWHKRRKLLTPTFHFRILDEFIHIFNEQGIVMAKKLEKNVGKPFDIFPAITLCTLDIICETAMGTSINAQDNENSEYVQALYGISDVLHSRMFKAWLWSDFLFALTSYGRRQKKYLEVLHSFTRKVIQERKAYRMSQKNKDVKQDNDEVFGKKKRLAFLDLLFDASETGHHLTDDDIQEEVDTFMFEGHDTTAAGIAWTIYLLGLHQEIQSKVHMEIDSVLGTEERAITPDDLKKLKYMECVIKEALRIYPSAPMISRTTSKDFELGNHTIPKGSLLLFFIYYLHRDARIFPNPEEFIPERFMESDSPDRHPFSYVPFSAGSRNCIGQRFAMMEEKVVLAHFLRSYRVESLEQKEDMKVLLELISRPKNGILVKLTSRKPFDK